MTCKWTACLQEVSMLISTCWVWGFVLKGHRLNSCWLHLQADLPHLQKRGKTVLKQQANPMKLLTNTYFPEPKMFHSLLSFTSKMLCSYHCHHPHQGPSHHRSPPQTRSAVLLGWRGTVPRLTSPHLPPNPHQFSAQASLQRQDSYAWRRALAFYSIHF